MITRLLVNNRSDNHWLAVDLRGPRGNAEAIGARVRIEAAGRAQTGWVGQSDGSRYSQGHYRVYFGLGNAPVADSVSVVWPDGRRTKVRDVEADQVLEIAR